MHCGRRRAYISWPGLCLRLTSGCAPASVCVFFLLFMLINDEDGVAFAGD